MKPVSHDRQSYDPYLGAFHAAFAAELQGAIARYRSRRPTRVLDVPCGNGFYTSLLARQMNGGELIAADLSPSYLQEAERVVESEHGTAQLPSLRFVKADAYHLPFESESFDLVWCAQSMISLDDPVAALREMRRVLKPRGTAAVLESDEFHHILLPWPVGLEVAIQRAIRSASLRKYGDGGKLAQARKLRAKFLEAGLTPSRKYTITADRQAPFDDTVREFLCEHFKYLRKFVRPELWKEEAYLFDQFTDEEGEESFFCRDDSELTCMMTVSQARR